MEKTIKDRKLTVDIGNTLTKIAVFEEKKMLENDSVESANSTKIEKHISCLREKYAITKGILSTVIPLAENTIEIFSDYKSFITLNHNTPLPFTNKYSTPKSLGLDRIALVAAARHIFPEQNNLVIDAGSCITFDFINKHNEYLGGSIAPGIEMRLKALNSFTGKLPLVKNSGKAPIIGTNTNESILSGVLNGTVAEIDGLINSYRADYSDYNVVFTGGDHIYFDKMLENSIFAFPNLTLIGLNEIFDFNANK